MAVRPCFVGDWGPRNPVFAADAYSYQVNATQAMLLSTLRTREWTGVRRCVFLVPRTAENGRTGERENGRDRWMRKKRDMVEGGRCVGFNPCWIETVQFLFPRFFQEEVLEEVLFWHTANVQEPPTCFCSSRSPKTCLSCYSSPRPVIDTKIYVRKHMMFFFWLIYFLIYFLSSLYVNSSPCRVSIKKTFKKNDIS